MGAINSSGDTECGFIGTNSGSPENIDCETLHVGFAATNANSDVLSQTSSGGGSGHLASSLSEFAPNSAIGAYLGLARFNMDYDNGVRNILTIGSGCYDQSWSTGTQWTSYQNFFDFMEDGTSPYQPYTNFGKCWEGFVR